MNLTFTSDTKHRKQFFTGVSFSHPAKMLLPLELWLIENYSKPGDVILDPMSGSGTVLVACSMGRNVICVELEAKFIEIIKGNWQKVQERGPMLGYAMGKAQIIQGDARNPGGLLVDQIITSPPYEASVSDNKEGPGMTSRPGAWKDGKATKVSYTQHGEQCKADVIMTSPPYAETQTGGGIAVNGYQGPKHTPTDLVGKRSYMPDVHGEAQGQIGNLKYGSIDAVTSSPPYENQIHKNSDEGKVEDIKAINPSNYVEHSQPVIAALYSPSEDNIGNLKSTSYLEAMLVVYQECFKVLKPSGIMALVTKNYIRNKQIVDLAADTIRLCESSGFTFKERHYRKLTSQSFWRTIYRQKYPDSPVLDTEDILIFGKAL